MNVSIKKRGDEVIDIALDDEEWARFLRRYGEDFLYRLCRGLIDPALSLKDIAQGLHTSVKNVHVWGKKIEPYVPVAYRIDGEIVVEVAQGNKTISVAVNRRRRQRFENKYGDMQKFFSLLAQECNSFQDVAGQYGMTREMVRQYYRQYLVPMLEAKNGQERRRVCTLARIHIDRFPDHVLAVWRRARRHSIAVSAVNSVSRRSKAVWTLRNVLCINDTLCRVHIASGDGAAARRTGRARFSIQHAGNSQDGFAFHICVVRFSGRHGSRWTYYVIPRDAIPNTQTFYLPLFPLAERALKKSVPWLVKYDWSPYRDAWHLIPPSEPVSQPNSE